MKSTGTIDPAEMPETELIDLIIERIRKMHSRRSLILLYEVVLRFS